MERKNVVVAGGGVLGSQIAFQTAYKGFSVTIWLRSEGSIERAQPKLDYLLETYLSTLEAMKTDKSAYCRGLADTPDLTTEQVDTLKDNARQAHKSLKLTTSYEDAVKDADIVIESIAEDPEQKISFYKNLAPYLPEKTIICTNSSTMLPSTFAQYTGRPDRYLALHFANQIWQNNTAEIMGQSQTSKESYDAIVQFAANIAMVPLELHKEQPGYILNSMLVPLLNAAQNLWANEVADPETIDKTWVLGTGAPYGPFRILDVVGLTTAYNIAIMDPRSKDPGTVQAKAAAKLKAMIDKGKTGAAAGEGFYRYK